MLQHTSKTVWSVETILFEICNTVLVLIVFSVTNIKIIGLVTTVYSGLFVS